jgi:hypothetical protein
MWGISFINSGLLFLAAGAAVPLIIHLLSRQKPRLIRFPAVRFIRLSQRKTYRRTRLKQLLLLLVRMAAIAAFALLVSRPVAHRGTGRIADGEAIGTPALVAVLDDSLSMRLRKGDATCFDAARSRAVELLRRLPPEHAVAALTTSQPSGKLAPNSEEQSARVAALRAGTGGAPCWRALEGAADLLHQAAPSSKDIVLFTDMTPSAWAGYEHRRVDLGADVDLHVVDCSSEGAVNGAVYGLADAGEPCMAGAQLGLEARILASGGPIARNVEFQFDGAVLERRTVNLEAGSETTFRFGALLEEGHHWGRVAFVNPDGLPEDDARAFTVEVAPFVSVLCVEDDVVADAESVSYFLRLALNPWAEEGRGVIRVRRASSGELADLPLGPFDVIVLAGAGRLGEDAWGRLRAYTSGGGGLLVFLGPETADTYRTEAAQSVLPAEVGTVFDAEPGKPLSLRVVAPDNPFVQALAASGATLGQAKFRACRQVKPAEDAEEVLSFGPGLPALLLATGRRRVAVFAATADERWSDFAKTEPFIPFCHEIVLYLANRQAEGIRSALTGSQVPIRFGVSSSPTIVQVTPPGAREPELLLPGTTPGQLTYWATERPGYYRLTFKNADREWEGGFALNTPPVESRLEKVPLDDLQDALTAGTVEMAGADVGLAVGLPGGAGAVELTPYLAFALLALLVAESFLANRFYPPAPER